MNFIKSILLASAAVVGTSSAVLAQSGAAQVQFKSGDNGGALSAAQSAYGMSTQMETAVVDLDGDQTAEIAVRFPGSCDDDGCTTTILYNGSTGWLEVFNHKAEYLALAANSKRPFKSLNTSDGVFWDWFENGYYPYPQGQEWATDLGEPSGVLTKAESKVIRDRFLNDINKYSFDFNKDGASETVILSQTYRDCNGHNMCPFFVFSKDGKLLLDGYANEAQVGIHKDSLVVSNHDGFSYYAFDGQNILLKESFSKSSIVQR